MPSFLLECFSEEIPSRMQQGAKAQLQRSFEAALKKADIAHGAISTYACPRHLAIHISGLPETLADRIEEKKGPKTNAPEAAIQGFLKSAGLTRADCEERTIGKDTYLFASQTIKGGKVADLLTQMASQILQDFSWPKSMRWGNHPLAWVRPLHRIMALFDDVVLPVTFHHLTASNITHGHRFLSPDAITIHHADHYVDALKAAYVAVDSETRKSIITAEIAEKAAEMNLTPVEDDALINEITGLVEWPCAYVSRFDEDFLKLPKEVLISEMKHHQRYVSLTDSAGNLQPHFIIISNMNQPAAKQAIIEGNARVLRARLSDGAFYYETDRAKKLADWAKGLDDVVFHAKVGMMNEKVARIEAISLKIVDMLGVANQSIAADSATITQAARLCKADLTTGMVGEFPELQGIMGRYYAIAEGMDSAIAEAIYEHYKPLGAQDSLPENALGAVLSLADKIDSITSLWAAGEKPTGSKDPLALRRAAIGILRILDQNQWKLDLSAFFPEQNRNELLNFFTDRMKNALREEGLRHDIIDAVLGSTQAHFIACEIFTRTRQFAKWLKTEKGEKTTAAIRRAQNIVAAEEKKDGKSFTFETAKADILTGPEETSLHQALLRHMQPESGAQFDMLFDLADPIEAFFGAVLVNADDQQLRNARLGLLSGATMIANRYADFSKLEGL